MEGSTVRVVRILRKMRRLTPRLPRSASQRPNRASVSGSGLAAELGPLTQRLIGPAEPLIGPTTVKVLQPEAIMQYSEGLEWSQCVLA